MTSPDTVTAGRVVAFHYVLTDDQGQELDRSGDQPLPILYGAGNVIPGMEKGLDGHKVGDKFSIQVPPEEGYGLRRPGLEQQVPRSAFPADANLFPGLMVQAETQDGQVVPLWLTQISDEHVTVDPNHPLAGQTLHFEVEIVEVREATPEEVDHGHVHMPGHHHH